MFRGDTREMRQKTGNRLPGLLLALCALVSLSLFFVPAFVIRPFRYQSERALSLAITVKWIAPALTVVLCLAALAFVLRVWRRASVASRVLAVVALLVTFASAVMVRQNYFEWMFQPIAAARFVNTDDAHLSAEGMVMTVQIGPDARAYPIAQMAYHHILNDTVGREAIVITY